MQEAAAAGGVPPLTERKQPQQRKKEFTPNFAAEGEANKQQDLFAYHNRSKTPN